MNLRTALVAWAAAKRARESVVWESEIAEYFWTPSGVPLAFDDVIANLDAYNEAVAARIANISAELADETRSLGSWQAAMHDEVKDAWRINYMAGRGGRHWMGQDDWGRVGGQLGYQYGKIEGFAQDIAAGKLSPAQISARADLYAKAPWRAHQSARQAAKKEAGFAEERRNEVMDAGTCGGCAGWHALGWRPIGTLPPPGSECECGANCRGEMEFRGQMYDELARYDELYELHQAALDGGFTYHPVTGTSPTEGLAYGVWKDREKQIPLKLVDEDQILHYIHKNGDLLLGDRAQYLGGWAQEGKLYLDVSKVAPADQFDRVTRACYVHEQEGFYNLGTGVYHDTSEEFAKLMEKAKQPIEQFTRSSADKKKKPTVQMTLAQVPRGDDDALRQFARKFADHMRKLGGEDPLYED